MTVRAALILSVLTALLALASPSFAATRATTAAPTGLHAFLLRVDEPRTEVFSRTPAFAWNPVRVRCTTSSSSRRAARSRTAESSSRTRP